MSNRRFKICFWLDIPSHHQNAFMNALHNHPDIDLQVRYRSGYGDSRLKQGWKQLALHEYEMLLPTGRITSDLLNQVLPDWKTRIHVYSFRIYSELPDLFEAEHVQSCHWSERGGKIVGTISRYHPLVYNMLMPFYIHIWKHKDSWILRNRISMVFAPGKLNQRYFRTLGVPAERIRNLYYAVAPIAEAAPDRKIVSFAHGRKCFLYIGSLYYLKGIDLLIRAWKKINNPKWCLVLCGYDFSDGKYQKMVHDSNLQDSVMFYGTCPADQIASIYHAANVFVFPTRYDGWGMVLQEAASTGLPLISTNMAGSSEEVITPRKNGFIVPADNMKKLAEAMDCYIKNENLIPEHGRNSFEIFNKKFTPEKNVERLIEGLSAIKEQRRGN